MRLLRRRRRAQAIQRLRSEYATQGIPAAHLSDEELVADFRVRMRKATEGMRRAAAAAGMSAVGARAATRQLSEAVRRMAARS